MKMVKKISKLQIAGILLIVAGALAIISWISVITIDIEMIVVYYLLFPYWVVLYR